MGLLKVNLIGAHIQHARLIGKAFVDRVRRVVTGDELLFQVQHHDLVQLGHRFGRPVIALHQGLTGLAGMGAAIWVLAQAQAQTQGALQIEHQAVFAPVGFQVQQDAHHTQPLFVAGELARLVGGDQATAGQLAPTVAQSSGLGHPFQNVQIAQAARRLFAIGLQGIGCVFELGVALAHLQGFRHKKGLGVHGLGITALKFCKQALLPADPARFEQRGLHRHIFGRLQHAFFNRSHARAHLHARVPALADEALDLAAQGVILFQGHIGWHQDQDIHIRIRIELAPPIATDSHQGQAVGQAALVEQLRQGLVIERTQRFQEVCDTPHRDRRLGQTSQQVFFGGAVERIG